MYISTLVLVILLVRITVNESSQDNTPDTTTSHSTLSTDVTTGTTSTEKLISTTTIGTTSRKRSTKKQKTTKRTTKKRKTKKRKSKKQKINKLTKQSMQIWPNRTVYYTFFNHINRFHLRKINNVISFIGDRTCIKFVHPSEEQMKKYYLLISTHDEKCFSELGWMNETEQKMNFKPTIISKGCFAYERILELVLRTLGFDGLTAYDHKLWHSQLGLREKHLRTLNRMYECNSFLHH